MCSSLFILVVFVFFLISPSLRRCKRCFFFLVPRPETLSQLISILLQYLWLCRAQCRSQLNGIFSPPHTVNIARRCCYFPPEQHQKCIRKVLVSRTAHSFIRWFMLCCVLNATFFLPCSFVTLSVWLWASACIPSSEPADDKLKLSRSVGGTLYNSKYA